MGHLGDHPPRNVVVTQPHKTQEPGKQNKRFPGSNSPKKQNPKRYRIKSDTRPPKTSPTTHKPAKTRKNPKIAQLHPKKPQQHRAYSGNVTGWILSKTKNYNKHPNKHPKHINKNVERAFGCAPRLHKTKTQQNKKQTILQDKINKCRNAC